MSKQSEAKQHQQYSDKPVLPVCGNCAHYRSEVELSAWQQKAKKQWNGNPFTIEEHGVEKNRRCAAGGFAVKKLGSCRLFELPTTGC